MYELVETTSQPAVIKVIGVGGGGGNAVNHMFEADFGGVDFINANTDAQVLQISKVPRKLQLGKQLTKGLGAGADPIKGRDAACEDRESIVEAITGTDMLFITAGMGGGTGTGAAPVIAELARDLEILTVAVVTLPFRYEGAKRMAIAERGIDELQGKVDSLIVVANEKVLEVVGQQARIDEAFARANEVLFNAVQGISDMIIRPGLINVDFADVKAVMSEQGRAMMGSATVSGENRAVEATQQAIASPLLESAKLRDAKAVLVNITASNDISLGDCDQVGATIGEYATPDAQLMFGMIMDPAMGDNLRVTMVATGLVDTAYESSSAKGQADEAPLSHERLRVVASAGERNHGRVMAVPSEKINLDIPSYLRRQAD